MDAIKLSTGVGADLNLNGDNILTTRYAMQTPEVDRYEVPLGNDQWALSRSELMLVTESIDLLITGFTVTQVRDLMRQLEARIDIARHSRYVQSTEKLYLTVSLQEDSKTYRSEIKHARIVYRDLMGQVSRKAVEVTLLIERLPYWEEPETHLFLTSAGNASATQSPVQLWVNDDATSQSNWFNVGSEFAGGSLPTPLRIQIRNADSTSRHYERIYFSNHTFIGSTALFRRGVQSDGGSGTRALTNNAHWNFDLTTAQVTAIGGRYCRMFAAFTTIPVTGWVAGGVSVKPAGTALPVVQGERVFVQSGSRLVDLGTFQVPPGSPTLGGVTPGVHSLTVGFVREEGTNSVSATIQFVVLMPVGEGLYRSIQSLGMIYSTGAGFKDDGMRGDVWSWAGSSHLPLAKGMGRPIMIWPGRNNHIRVLADLQSTFVPGISFDVQAFYRARRLTI
jgi:hypothetical protein